MPKDLKKLQDNKDLYLSYEEVDENLTWCGGCGNYGIQRAIFQALALEDISQKECVIAYDVGCSGNESDKLGAYTIHGLHGRVLPLSQGIKLANPNLKVIAHAGDGATFSEGVNHLVHAVRNDYPILFIHHNNGNYGLTIGQASATSRVGQKLSASPDGVTSEPINTLDFVLSLKPTFVARSFSGDLDHMTEMIQAGLNHRGFAFLEIAQACPTFNKFQTHEWYLENIYDISEVSGYDSSDVDAARKIVRESEDSIATGIIYQVDQPNFLERIKHLQDQKSTPVADVNRVDIGELLEEFR